jgi:hypothetical protein
MMMPVRSWALYPLILLLLVSACKKDSTNPTVTVPTVITLQDPPTTMLADRDSTYTFYVRVTEGNPADSIQCDVTGPQGTALPSFMLYDDGNYGAHATPTYANAHSGDVVPLDGIFTRGINGRTLASGVTGQYTFVFHPLPEGNSQAKTLHVSIENVDPCLITSYPQTSDFAMCFDPMPLEVHVRRDSLDEVQHVLVSISNGAEVLDTEAFSPTETDTVWRLNFTPSAFRYVGTAVKTYSLLYQAQTRFGWICGQSVDSVSYTNQSPTLSDCMMPDTVYRPFSPADTDTVIFTIKLNDCEILGDTGNAVFFNISKNNPNDWIPSVFVAVDNGRQPDSIGGNGIYTAGLKLAHSDTLLNNMWYFRFYAVDPAPPHEQSDYLLDSMRIIQDTTAALYKSGASSGWGLSFIP